MKWNPGDRAFNWRRHGVVVLVLAAWLIQGAGYWMVTGAPDAKARVEHEETGPRVQIRKLRLTNLTALAEEYAAPAGTTETTGTTGRLRLKHVER